MCNRSEALHAYGDTWCLWSSIHINTPCVQSLKGLVLHDQRRAYVCMCVKPFDSRRSRVTIWLTAEPVQNILPQTTFSSSFSITFGFLSIFLAFHSSRVSPGSVDITLHGIVIKCVCVYVWYVWENVMYHMLPRLRPFYKCITSNSLSLFSTFYLAIFSKFNRIPKYLEL